MNQIITNCTVYSYLNKQVMQYFIFPTAGGQLQNNVTYEKRYRLCTDLFTFYI